MSNVAAVSNCSRNESYLGDRVLSGKSFDRITWLVQIAAKLESHANGGPKFGRNHPRISPRSRIPSVVRNASSYTSKQSRLSTRPALYIFPSQAYRTEGAGSVS
jgi:hypothetical protein